jgi:hypothetical protein
MSSIGPGISVALAPNPGPGRCGRCGCCPGCRRAGSGAAIIVLRSNGPQATVYGVHGATAVVLLATAALLFT